jgi:hypothetical protein
MTIPDDIWGSIEKGVRIRLTANLEDVMAKFRADERPDFSTGAWEPGTAVRLADSRVERAGRLVQRSIDAYAAEWLGRKRKLSYEFWDEVQSRGLLRTLKEQSVETHLLFEQLRNRLPKNDTTSFVKKCLDELDRAIRRYGAGIAILRRAWVEQIYLKKKDCHLHEAQRPAAQKKGLARRPGYKVPPIQKRFRAFVKGLWREKQNEARSMSAMGRRRVSGDSARRHVVVTLGLLIDIAKRLDETEFVPPGKFLEGKVGKALRSRNTQAGNTKPVASPTRGAAMPKKKAAVVRWIDIANGDDAELKKAMRTVLSRWGAPSLRR